MAFLNIDNKKMSKSLGNFFTVREIGEKYDLAGAAFLHAERTLQKPDQLQRRAYGSFQKRSGAYHHMRRTLKRALNKVPEDALSEELSRRRKRTDGQSLRRKIRGMLWTMTSIQQMPLPLSLSW